ncbi:small-conductance mechanosensitive channel [Oleiphilus messinensis]|uniref:Small-conductance mechanosensitive channel n=1 Tax=Oleiphilus messinensis TaxID=141451 RepID=A0A1Y0I9C5_9GAMM|nr:mechanosensitive ion channel domain-containing protein [Oleiphilus messinensis]ARU56769.1 small-conductance mechanosensitive channel [Oleiphilus messinensis]
MTWLLVALVFVIYGMSLRFIGVVIRRLGMSKEVHQYRITYITKTLDIAATLVMLIIISLILGIEYNQVTVFVSSVFAVIGVALFAQWSILSNITASLIIFFGFPYRVGDWVKVLDGENSVSGQINEITLFHVIIQSENEIMTYPNNLIIQKAVMKSSEQRLSKEPSTEKSQVDTVT